MSDRDDRYDTLAPSFVVKLGGSALPVEAVADIVSVSVLEDVDAAGMCVLRLNGWDGVEMKVKYMDDSRYAEGNPVEIEIGYTGQRRLVFSGDIVGLEPDFLEGQSPTLSLRCYDVRHRLMRERRTHSYLNMKDSDIASQAAQAVGLGAKTEDSGVNFAYLLQHNQTDFQFLATRAARIGWELAVDERTILFRPRPSDAKAALTLRREIELLQFRPRLSTMGQSPSREVRGWSPSDKKAVVSRASVGDEGDLMGGSASGGAATRRAFPHSGSAVVDRPVQSSEEADQLARHGFREMGRSYIRADGVCIGEPRMRAGTVVEIAGIGDRFGGLYYLNQVEHRFDPKSGYRTRFAAQRNAT